jgi:arylsulfatase A-like enzyme
LLSVLLMVGARVYSSEKPNVLFIMSDDHMWQATGLYGGRLAALNPTPTIDALAHEGMVMENAFCQNAICTPSRASIMTGQGSAVNGCETLDRSLPKKRQYLALEMKKAGYDTAVIGKWHLGARPEAFDYWKVLPGQGAYFDPIFAETGATETFTVNKGEMHDAVQMKGHSSDCITDSVLKWFKEMRDPAKPFFLKMHFKAPHGGFHYAPRYESYLADVDIPEPDNLFETGNHGSIATRGHNGELLTYIGSSISPRHRERNYSSSILKKNKQLSDAEATKQAYQTYLKKYLRCVKGVDDNIKRVVDFLKEEGLFDNTVIIYTGDQGFYLGEHDYIDKRWPYDESMRMPFMVRYPGSVQTGRSDAMVENIDFTPTMLDFAGVPTPGYMQGQSFRSILETGTEPAGWKQSAYYHYWMHMSSHFNPACIAIRTKRHKLILYYGCVSRSKVPETPPAWEFYDLEKDPSEMNNLYGHPECQDIIARLKADLKVRRTELGEYAAEKSQYNAVIDEYWNYGSEQRARAIEISAEYTKTKPKRQEMKSKEKNKNKKNRKSRL